MSSQISTPNPASLLSSPAQDSLGLRVLALPILLAGTLAILAATHNLGWSAEARYSAVFFPALAYLALLERLVPFRREWQPSGGTWLRNLLYFGHNGIFDALTKGLIALAAIQLATGENELPLWLGAPLAILVREFFAYWVHRLGHREGLLWRIHGIHHVPDQVNLVNNNTAHFLNIVQGTLFGILPLMLLGFSPAAVAIAIGLSSTWSFFVHTNAQIAMGPLGVVVFGPEHHRLHHSVVLEEAGNFGTFLNLWDRVFGTYRNGLAPRVVGVTSPEDFPAERQLLLGAAHPFRPGKQYPVG